MWSVQSQRRVQKKGLDPPPEAWAVQVLTHSVRNEEAGVDVLFAHRNQKVLQVMHVQDGGVLNPSQHHASQHLLSVGWSSKHMSAGKGKVKGDEMRRGGRLC